MPYVHWQHAREHSADTVDTAPVYDEEERKKRIPARLLEKEYYCCSMATD